MERLTQGLATTSSVNIVIQCITLVIVANGAPILFEQLLGRRFCDPIDAGIVLGDGHPLLGPSKTWRGVAAALLVTGFAAALIGLPWLLGVVAAFCAMIGDCLSSFVKRRLGLAAGGRAVGLDQIPESLLPALACAASLRLGPVEVFIIVAVFTVGHMTVSQFDRAWPS